MDILTIAFLLANAQLSNYDYNRLFEIIKNANREDLFKTRFSDVKEDIFKFLEEQSKKDC